MDTKTGRIKTLKEFEEELGPEKLKTQIDEGAIVPVPEEQVEMLKNMTWREKQNWLDVQAAARREKEKQ